MDPKPRPNHQRYLEILRALTPQQRLEKAIELNGEAVVMNKAAFHWGRRAAFDRASVESLAKPAAAIMRPMATTTPCPWPSSRK